MVVICIIAVRSKAVLLIVVLVAWHTLVGVDLLDVMRLELLTWAV